MLIVPVAEGLNWRRPPPITIALILVNCLVFFLYQSGDDARERRAQQAYFDSSLPARELPRYLEHLDETEPETARRLRAVAALEAARPGAAAQAGLESSAYLLARMEADVGFMSELRARRRAAAATADGARWNADRAAFEGLRDKVSTRRFGFVPAEHELPTWVTSLFMHGDLMHLAGNMVFLFIVGVAVESALGAGWTLGLYLACGIAANALFFAIRPGSTVPLVGASGAISGLMGLFTVVFGLRPVRFFYWVLFLFGFRTLPGLVVLPIWVAYELLEFALDRDSQVAYMAHAGGLISGALLGLLVVRRLHRDHVAAFHAERGSEAADRAEYARARADVGRLDFKAASAGFARLAKRFPGDEELLDEWYAVAKTDPASPAFHEVAALIVGLARPTPTFALTQSRVLIDYLKRGGAAARVESAVLAALALRAARRGDLAAADIAAEALFRQAPRDDALAEIWAALAHAHGQTSAAASVAKAGRYAALLAARQRAAVAR